MSATENNANSLKEIPGGIKVKTEPVIDPTKRLSSFKQPRDLMLKSFALNKPVTKKVFVPNLNVARNKIKGPQINENNRDRRKIEKHNTRDRTKGAQNKQPNILKSGGVFSEGIAVTNTRRYNTRESYSGGSRDGAETLSKPVFKPKTDNKIESDLGNLKIEEYASDEDESNDVSLDTRSLPIRLPMDVDAGLLSQQLDRGIIKAREEIKLESVIKTEPIDDIMTTDVKVSENLNTKIKVEPKPLIEMMDILQSSEMTFFMLQFPDNLPGRGPDQQNEPREKNSTDETPPETNVESGCKFEHLEEGPIGKIVLHKSGKIKFLIGNTHYDLDLGSQCCFRQEIMSISVDEKNRTGRMINLANISAKITAIPDWEKMFDDYSNS